MAPAYKLTYFNARGLAESTRLIFAFAGVDYEDIRMENDKWPELKGTLHLPFGKLPILEWDGNVLAESRAIARYAAREYGLAGKTNIDQAIADSLVDGIFDLFQALGSWYTETDPERKEGLKKKLAEETTPNALKHYHKILQKNGTGFFVGDSLTWADLTVFNGLQALTGLYPTLLENYEDLRVFIDKISNIPSIKAWVEKRPVTQF